MKMTSILVGLLLLMIGVGLIASGCQAVKSFVTDHKSDIISLITDIVARILNRAAVQSDKPPNTVDAEAYRAEINRELEITIDGADLNDPAVQKLISDLIDEHFNNQ